MIPKSTRLLSWGGALPEPGDYLETVAGSLYLVFTVRENLRPERKSVAFLQLGKLDAEERAEVSADARRHSFAWAPRK